MEKPLHHYPLAWIIALLPYKLGFLCVIFGDATIAEQSSIVKNNVRPLEEAIKIFKFNLEPVHD